MNSVLPNQSIPYNWQGAKSSIKERLAYIFNNELMADIFFVVGKPGQTQRIPAHKFVLSIGSAVFDAMFNGGMADSSTQIELPDIEPSAFLSLLKVSNLFDNLICAILFFHSVIYSMNIFFNVKKIYSIQFLYTDEVQIDPENVMIILYTAKKYAVPALEQACVEFLKRNLSSDNAFMLLTQARLFDEPQLAAMCFETIDKNTSDALNADGFTEIDVSTLGAVLQRDTLG